VYVCACVCECVSARASECMGECVRSQAEAIITSWRPAQQPREPSCPPDRRVNHYAIPARSASTQTSGGRRRRTRAPEGVQRRFPSRSGGDAPYAALHGTPFSTTHSKLLLQRRAWLAESTVHESTLTVATAIPTPEQILARDEAMSTRNAGEAVMSRDSNRARMFPPAPRYLVLRPVGSPRANAPNAGVHAATKARGPPRVWSPPRPARPHAPRGHTAASCALARIGLVSCDARCVARVSASRTAMSGHDTSFADALVRGARVAGARVAPRHAKR
jgi:hypothetical protein